MQYPLHLKISVALASALMLGGCAGIPADRGFPDSQALIKSHGGPAVEVPLPDVEAQAQTAEWLEAPLTVESAQRVALTRNPRLLQQYARLGIAQAALYDAARLSNPVLSFAWLDSNAGAAQVSVGLAQNFADLLYLSPRKRRASGELARTQQQVAGDLLDLAAEVERAYYAYIGAIAVAELREVIATASTASAQLAQRFFEAGNISRLELNREQAVATEARIAGERAATQALTARAALNALLGLTAAEDRWSVEAQLHLPVNAEDGLSKLQTLAQDARLDLLAARQSVVILEDVLGVTRSYRLIGDTRLGVRYEHEDDHSRLIGPTLAMDLPIFNWGSGKVERARAELDQARAEARRLEIEISNAVRLAHARVTSGRRQVQRYRTQLIPQREEVVMRAMEMQNFMIIGQFELLLAKREEYDAYQGYLETLADYWVARAELAQAVGARLPSSAQIETEVVEPSRLITPTETGGGHAGHDSRGATGGMSGMDMRGGDSVGGMNHSADAKRSPDAKSTPPPTSGYDMKDMEHNDRAGSAVHSAAKEVACERLESADMTDPLMQALAEKCRKQAQPATGAPPADASQLPSGGEHKH